MHSIRYKTQITHHFENMGVRRLFSRGGQKYPRGARTYFSPNNNKKDTIFHKKVLKYTSSDPKKKVHCTLKIKNSKNILTSRAN